MSPTGRVLGLDFGSRRVGVAVTDTAQRLATPVAFLRRTGDRRQDHRAVADLVAEYEAVGIVVGLPLSLSGEVGRAAAAVLAEVDELRHAVDVEVDTVDERLTTRQAAEGLRAAGRAGRDQRQVIDAAAATVLLQSWIDREKATS